MTTYTIELYKSDKRYLSGEKLEYTFDVELNERQLREFIELYSYGFRVVVQETYREATNYLTGNTYRERYDTPHCCSPSSETYWSM